MAGAGFIRRYSQDPGLEELSAIEGVVIIDREPPAAISGVGTGTVILVGEFEDGAFETPLEMTSGADVLTQFGGFGFTYDGVPSNNPCARKRLADATLIPEFWNGNGFIALANKRFRRLILCRVDTSVGSVSFTRQAALLGRSDFAFDLATGQTLVIDIGAGNVVATFTGLPATVTSAAGVYPSTFAGGEQITFKIDGTQYQAIFLAGDQSQAQVISRLNASAGYTAFVAAGATIVFTGRQGGTGGSVQIVSLDALVATATGFAAAAAIAGTGNVANIDAVSQAEANTVVSGTVGLTTVRVDRDATGKIRVYNTAVTGADTIKVATASTATAFGFTTDTVVNSNSDIAGIIPAGTRVRNVGGTEWVTMQAITVGATSAGPYTAKVRPANDDGTTSSALTATVTTVPFAIDLGRFGVSNALPLAAALSEGAIDAKYQTAIDKTKTVSNVSRQTNIVIAARQSNAIRGALRANAVDASAAGCYGRQAVVSPPLKTTRLAARSTTAQPGVGSVRGQRVIYAFPGVQTQIPQIAIRGTSGGVGFTANGVIDVRFDSFIASLRSLLPPEENIGQLTEYLFGVFGIEAGNADVQAMEIGDYRALKAAGIAAPRIDDGVAIVQSAVNNVDPLTQGNLKNIARRAMADFIQDSLSVVCNAQVKKLATADRFAGVLSLIDTFLAGLQSKDNRANQRIDSYSISGKAGNTPAAEALGVKRVVVKVKTLASLDVIVLDTEIGETVVVTVDDAA